MVAAIDDALASLAPWIIGAILLLGGTLSVAKLIVQLRRMGTPVGPGPLIWKTRTSAKFENTLLPNQFYGHLVSWIGFTEHECVLSVLGVRRTLDIRSVTRRSGRFVSRSLEIVTERNTLWVYPADLEGTLHMLRQMGLALETGTAQ